MTYNNSSRVKRDKKIVIFDTNTLLFMIKKPLNILDDLEKLIKEPYIAAVLDITLMEINKLTRSKSIKLRLNALTVRDFIYKKLQVIASNKENLSADEAIYQFAVENNCIVVTGDKKLRQMLRHKGVRVICIRNKHLKEC